MIDIHCHIIPGIDDGAKDMDTAVKMARIAEEDNTDVIIATPHFWYGFYENCFSDVAESVSKLNDILVSSNIDLKLLPGQEVFLDEHTLELYKSGEIKGLNGSKYVLMELPMDRMPHNAMETIYELHVLGAEVIIAHPERYMYIINKPSVINEFIEEKCFFQINTGSITGLMGGSVKKTAEKLIAHNICHFIASDAHSSGRRRPGLKAACKNFDENLKLKIEENSQKLLDNFNIENYGEKIRERSFFNLLMRKQE